MAAAALGATNAPELPADALSFYIDNDEETFALLVQSKVDVKERLAALFERIRQDPLETSSWKQWVDLCHSHGIVVPFSSGSLYQAEIPRMSHPLPGTFDTPGGKAHLAALTAILQIQDTTAIQITLSCMRDVPSQPGQHVYGSHALLEKVLEYAYRQRLARLKVIAEALRAEKDPHHGHREHVIQLLNGIDQKSTTGDKQKGLFMLLLLTACWTDTDLTREQYLPAKDLWVYNAEESLEPAAKESQWKALCRRIHGRQQAHVHQARLEALEALVVLVYGRYSLCRPDYGLLLAALSNHDFFTSLDFVPRMGQLAGLLCVEACELCQATQNTSPSNDWVQNHALVRGMDQPAIDEKTALLRWLSILLHSSSGNNRPQGLAALSFGCLVNLAGNQEGYTLVNTAIDKSAADVFLEEVMINLVQPPSLDNEPEAFSWFDLNYQKLDTVFANSDTETDEFQTELTAPNLIYASVGRELVTALINTLQTLLLDPLRTSHVSNMHVLANMIQCVHRNSTELCLFVWGEWDALGTRENRMANSPICHVIYLSQDLANGALQRAGTLQPHVLLEACVPLLKLVASLVNDSTALCAVMETILPPSMLYFCVHACDSPSTDPVKMETLRIEILQSISLLVQLARTDKSREFIRRGLRYHAAPEKVVGPDFMFHMAQRSGSTETLRLVTLIAAGLLPGAPPTWFLQATYGMDIVHQQTTGGIFGREKSSTEALVDLTHALVLQLNSLFFDGELNDDAILSGLNALSNALSSVAHVLVSSTSGLSGSLFGGDPLPLRMASKILKTLGNAFIMLQPICFSHRSEQVKSAAGRITDGIAREISRKAGVGGSAFFYASLPAALGLAFEMYDITKDSALARTVQANHRVGGAAFREAHMRTLNTLLASRADEIGGVSVNLFSMETDGWLIEGSAEDVRLVSSAAFRTVLIVFDFLKNHSRLIESSDINLSDLILSEALPPLSVRQNTDLHDAWSSSRVTYMHLLVRLMALREDDSLASLVSFSLFNTFLDEASPNIAWMLRNSAIFRSVVKTAFGLLKKIVELPANESGDIADVKFVTACVRTLTKCFEKEIDVVPPINNIDNWKVLGAFVRIFAAKGTLVSNDEVLLCDECLRCLLILHKKQTSLHHQNYVTIDSKFLADLKRIEFGEFFVNALSFDSTWSNSYTLEQSNAAHLLTTCLNFLSFELQQDADTNRFTSILQGDTNTGRDLLAWARDALLLKSLKEFSNGLLAYRNSVQRANVLVPDTVVDLVDTYGRHSLPSSTETLSFWLESLYRTGHAWIAFSGTLLRLRSMIVFFRQEVAFLEAAQCLVSIVCRNHQHMAHASPNFKGAMVAAVIHCLDENMEGLSISAGEVSIYGLLERVPVILAKYPPIIVELSSDESLGHTRSIDLLKSIRENAVRSLSHLAGQRQYSLVAQQLLLAAFDASRLLDNPSSRADGKCDSLMVDLACVASKVLTRFQLLASEMWGENAASEAEALSCFLVCVDFLKHACSFSKSGGKSMSALTSALVESGVSSVLVSSLSEDSMRQHLGPAGILSVLELFQLISLCLEKTMLLSLLRPGMHSALASTFAPERRVVVIAGVAMNGYRPLQSNSMSLSHSPAGGHRSNDDLRLQIGEDDMLHQLHVRSTSFVASALRSVTSKRLFADDAEKMIRCFALDFLGNHGERLLQCLYEITKISFDAEVKHVTVRSIQEAATVLALVGELCRDHNIDEFKGRFQRLFQCFVAAAKEVSRSMCLFLGASAASRELFWYLMLEDGDQQTPEFGLSPLTDYSTARHEAIRFSHFVSRCSSAVSESEFKLQATFPGQMKPPSRRLSTDDPHSESAFERKCRDNITNGFALTLEVEVAKCLFHALDIVWKTHPIRSSYVEFSQDELQKIDLMRFVRVGTMISFRLLDDRGAVVGVGHGEVRRIDIACCTWDVAVYDSASESSQTLRVIPMNQLLGIEDEALRKPILKFSLAPENSSEMERLGLALSTGHLIAGLRWCHEYSFQRKASPGLTVQKRLAHILAAVLGIEVSLVRESPQKSGRIAASMRHTLALHLYDLFAHDGDLVIDAGPELQKLYRTEGRLCKILEGGIWEALRLQMGPELELAAKDHRERQEKQRQRPSDGGGFFLQYSGSPRYRNPRSPFRQLSH